ncbi:MAG: hypothetical protein AAFP90_23175, partial [Planctomycetota bacterium]
EEENKSSPFADKPVFKSAIIEALHISPDGSSERIPQGNQLRANPSCVDAIRRHALEWIGRKMLARLTALWVIVRIKEQELFENAWDDEVKDQKRSRYEDFNPWDNCDCDLDPEGDYFFTSKSIQTGRRPWNIEMPFSASWESTEEDSYPNRASDKKEADDHREFVNGKWMEFPQVLADLVEEHEKMASENMGRGWFADGKGLVEHLFEKIKGTRDLIHATRRPQGEPRPSREAELAIQHESAERWINSVMERILRNNWVRPHMSRTLYDLGYASIWRRPDDPVEFKYHSDRAQLVAQDPNVLQQALSRFRREQLQERGAAVVTEDAGIERTFTDTEPPRIAIASFNTTERSLRMRFINRDISDNRILNINVDYRIRRSQDKTQNIMLTRHGLLRLI